MSLYPKALKHAFGTPLQKKAKARQAELAFWIQTHKIFWI
jgi:hypothetical protein